MAMPFYVSPDQIMQDKAEYARKGIAKGRSIVAIEFADGMLLMAENPSASLNKISEIYDRIAFAGVGKYSEFENLRKAGIRYADLKGYSYSRQDVTTKSLANAYSETIGTIFTRDPNRWKWKFWWWKWVRPRHKMRCIMSRLMAVSPTTGSLR